MEIFELSKKIIISFQMKDYKMVVNYFEIYLSHKEYGIYDSMLNMYILSLANLNRFDEALKYLNIMEERFPDFYDPAVLASMYVMFNDLEKAESILINLEFNADVCFNLAKIYFFRRDYVSSKSLFQQYLRISSDEGCLSVARRYLSKIENHFKYDAFCNCQYKYFKASGDKLMPGHVIYLKDTSSFDFSMKRPLMVYKIDGDKVYGFPVTTKINDKRGYVLYAQNYPNIGLDRRIKDTLYCFDESNIWRVIDFIKPNDFKYVIWDLYKKICFEHNELTPCNPNVFMQDMLKKIDVKENDVIVLYDAETKNKTFNFVVRVNSDSYDVVLVDTCDYENYNVSGLDINRISKNRYILEVIKLKENDISDICTQINSINVLKRLKLKKNA